MCNLFQFPGVWGVIVGICLFLAAWWLAWLKLKGHGFAMDAEGKEGAFEPRLTNYLDIAKFVLGLASGSIVLLVGSTAFHEGGVHLPSSFASPLYLLGLSVIYGLLLMVLMVLDYEGYQHKTKAYSRLKYSRNLALGFGCLLCFGVGYAALIFIATRRQ